MKVSLHPKNNLGLDFAGSVRIAENIVENQITHRQFLSKSKKIKESWKILKIKIIFDVG